MVIPIPLLEGVRAGGHGLCLSPLEKRRSGVMAIPIPLLEGVRAGGHGLCGKEG